MSADALVPVDARWFAYENLGAQGVRDIGAALTQGADRLGARTIACAVTKPHLDFSSARPQELAVCELAGAANDGLPACDTLDDFNLQLVFLQVTGQDGSPRQEELRVSCAATAAHWLQWGPRK